MLRLIKVVGDSMLPTLSDGDILIIKKARSIRPGFVIVVDHPSLGRIVKRVAEVSPEGVRLTGDNPASTSAAEMGLVPSQSVNGKVVLAITPKGLRRLRTSSRA